MVVGPFRADIVAEVENRTTPKISQKLIFYFSTAATLFNGVTKVRGRFWMKECGLSRRRARTASEVLGNFVRHAKKTFATISARTGHAVVAGQCLLLGVDRTCH